MPQPPPPSPARAKFLAEITGSAQNRVKRGIYGDAPSDKAEIDALGAEIAARHGGVLMTGGLKSMARAEEKVGADYGGDWHQIKDIARITLIVPSDTACEAALLSIQEIFSAGKGRGVVNIKRVTAGDNACGYSGTTAFVRTTSGRVGEIQLNSADIIYAKMSELKVAALLGPARFNQAKNKFRLIGGMGHVLYEVFRAPKAGQRPFRSAEVSRGYYEYFRKGIFNQTVRDRLLEELAEVGVLPRSALPGRRW